MRKKLKDFWSRAAPKLAAAGGRAARAVGKYLDDLCLVAAGWCVTQAAHGLLGQDWATLVAGAWLALYAVVVARARGGER